MDFYKEWLGIPDGPRPPDHYELLRLKQFDDETAKVRANYKKLNTPCAEICDRAVFGPVARAAE